MSQHYVTKRGANHGLHIVLTLLTCGIWAVTGWPIAAIMGRKTRTTVQQAPPGYYAPLGPPPPYGPPPGAGYPPQQPPPGQWGPPQQ